MTIAPPGADDDRPTRGSVASTSPSVAQQHWRKTRLATAVLLLAWLVVIVVPVVYARDWQGAFWGWPLSFWIAAQGAPLAFVVLIGVYARWMNRLDREARHAQAAPTPPEGP